MKAQMILKTKINYIIVLLGFMLVSNPTIAVVYQVPATTSWAITVNGQLDEPEWATANWIPLDKPYYQTVTDVDGARWAALWNPQTNLIYVAVTATDSVPYLSNAFSAWDAHDAVEIYLDAGNQNALAEDYRDWNYDRAQQFIAGIKPDSSGSWVVMSDGRSVPGDLIVAFAAGYTIDGGAYVYAYEFAIRPYSYYTGLGAPGTNQEVTLATDVVIGLDVVLSSRYGSSSGDFGMLCNNTLTGKYRFPQNFQDYKLVLTTDDQNSMIETNAGFYTEKGDILNASQWHAQSYKPVKNYLYAVDLCFEENKNVSGTFTLEIWENNPNADENADPRVGSQPLATSTVSQLTTGSNPSFIRWVFLPAIDLSSYAGQSEKILFFVKTNDTGIRPMLNSLGDTPPFGYEAGKYYYISGSNWQRVDNYDMAFRTLAVDDPGPIYSAVSDQRQLGSTNARNWNSTTLHGQSFEPQYPYLYAVRARVSAVAGGKLNLPGNYTVEIWRHHSGRGTYADPRIGTEPLGVANLNLLRGIDSAGWVTWEFAPPLDLSAYYLQRPQPLMLLFKTDQNNLITQMSRNDPYPKGNEYYVQNVNDPDPQNWSWTKYISNDMTFETYGGYLPIPGSCGLGTPNLAGDLTGDCYVNLADLLKFVQRWLYCTDPQDPECNTLYR